MQIEVLENEAEYKQLHRRVFGKTVDKPPVVYVGRGGSGDAVAFVAGFWNTDDHFYIQYAGVVPEYQKRGYLRYLASIFQNDIEYSMSVVNTNIDALRIALSVGFVPVGFYLRGDTYFVQLERGKIDG